MLNSFSWVRPAKATRGRSSTRVFKRSIPFNGRYVEEAAVTDENGIVSMPNPTSFHVAGSIGIGGCLGVASNDERVTMGTLPVKKKLPELETI